MATAHWASNYWATRYWHVNHWSNTAAAPPAGAYWHANYWHANQWHANYWAAIPAGSSSSKEVADTLAVTFTIGDFSDQGIELPEALTVGWTESLALLQQRGISDTYQVVFTDSASFSGGVTVEKNATDTVTVTFTEGLGLTETIDADDTLTPVLTDDGAAAVDAEAIEATDALTVTVTESAFVQSFLALESKAVSDGLQIVWTESAPVVRTVAKGVKVFKRVTEYRLNKWEIQ
jgi:hypothetical protein